jgi:hypothetical protein
VKIRLRSAALLGLAVSGCIKYAKVKNPDPVGDLEANVSVLRVSRIFDTLNAEQRIVLDVRVRAPRDSFVQLDSMPALLLPARGTSGSPLRGRLETVTPDAARQFPGAVIAPRHTARLLVEIHVPDERMVPGREHRLTVTWCTRASVGGVCNREESRPYELRIVRVNYGAVAALGVVLAGALFAVGGT